MRKIEQEKHQRKSLFFTICNSWIEVLSKSVYLIGCLQNTTKKPNQSIFIYSNSSLHRKLIQKVRKKYLFFKEVDFKYFDNLSFNKCGAKSKKRGAFIWLPHDWNERFTNIDILDLMPYEQLIQNGERKLK